MRKTLMRRYKGSELPGGPCAFAGHAIVFETEGGPIVDATVEIAVSFVRCEKPVDCSAERSCLVRECTAQ